MKKGNVAFCLQEKDDKGKDFWTQSSDKTLYGKFDSQPYKALGIKVKANNRKKLEQVEDYVYKPPSNA
jgi:hypothetical protein